MVATKGQARSQTIGYFLRESQGQEDSSQVGGSCLSTSLAVTELETAFQQREVGRNLWDWVYIVSCAHGKGVSRSPGEADQDHQRPSELSGLQQLKYFCFKSSLLMFDSRHLA